jgi:gamma-glutamylcysteine synthetase
MSTIYEHFMAGFDRALASDSWSERRIGAELKFPLVNLDGTAASLRTVRALWEYLIDCCGWRPVTDGVTGQIAGASKPGPQNDNVASCETGFCKTEFSLAHVGDLFELAESIAELRKELQPFARNHRVRFLGYGIQPVTVPNKSLLFKKSRSCFWDKAMPSNRRIPPEQGDDVHLFTVNAGSHVHVSVGPEDATKAVNVLAGFAGPQIALTAHSGVWQGRADDRYKCVNEKLWDWWKPAEGRSGVPAEPFDDLEDYVRTVENLRPIYVKREGQPIILRRYDAFCDYFSSEEPTGETLEGDTVPLVPRIEDIQIHNSCYWYTARISQYFTVENRANDQQPPGELLCVSALTLGLLSALNECWEVLCGYDWQLLREARDQACRSGLDAAADGLKVADLAAEMLDLARVGLRRRGLGEDEFLTPLDGRLRDKRCPADDAARVFARGGMETLVASRHL